MLQEPILTVDGLAIALRSKNGRQPLVRGISFSVQKGRVLGLAGESGCGKSLTCLAIMGLLPVNIIQTGGEVKISGASVNRLARAKIRALRGKSVAMILQNPMSCFDPVFTIRHHFQEMMASHGLKEGDHGENRVSENLKEVGFDDPARILESYPFQMSGGMLQRVMVALALLMRTPLLIADEPTTDLDMVSQARILDLLVSLRDQHQTGIVLVTHDLSVIARLADEVAIMRRGEIVEIGPVGAVFRRPRLPYTQTLLRSHFSLYGPHLDRITAMTQGKQPLGKTPTNGRSA